MKIQKIVKHYYYDYGDLSYDYVLIDTYDNEVMWMGPEFNKGCDEVVLALVALGIPLEDPGPESAIDLLEDAIEACQLERFKELYSSDEIERLIKVKEVSNI